MGDRKFVQDYTMVCRTCLQSNAEMLSLSALIDDIREESLKISYMECLKTCIQVEETIDIEMPHIICIECASALQVSYWFIKNASQAQELLEVKLREISRKKQQLEIEAATEENKKPKRYRCKICNVKVETKRSLKQHVKLHLDIIVYICQLCPYESNNRNSLCDHYAQFHEVEATRDQLKPKTKLSTSSSIASTVTTYDRIDGAIKNEHFQILPEITQQTSYETLTEPEPSISTNSLCSTETLQMPTVITTANSNYTTLTGPLMEEEVNDLNIANEFMVMADGSLEKVMNEGVVIEYIDDPNNETNLNLENGLVIENIIQVQNINNTAMQQSQNDIGLMDIDDLIIEDQDNIVEEKQEPILLPLEEETIPASIIEQPKKVMCKICTKDFFTQEQLKNHMLTHNEIPHFFCDQCKFYTFFKIDLHQHYKSKHNMQPTYKQLQPRNKQKTTNEIYACDLCFYEFGVKTDLKMHYKAKHNIEADDIHLRPTKIEKFKSISSSLSAKAKAASLVTKNAAKAATSKTVKYQSDEQSTPDYPNGLNCRKCHEVFFWRKKLYEHYKMHNAEEAALKQEKQLLKIQNRPTTSNLYQNKTKTTKKSQTQTSSVAQTQLVASNTSTYSSLCTLALNITSPNISTLNSVAPLTPSSNSTYTLPSDAIPQIVETDQTIENVMDFDFHCGDDTLFGDFDDDVDVENDTDDNDTEFRNILLTSDDDFEDMLQDQNDACAGTDTTESYCAHCQKSFISQYQFENHMFVHRGLAPYRCELCTNLYNTKRCLIRHYRAVHKNVPTRDMIQAKGDKVCDEKTPLDLLKIEPKTCLMCAKCPYESSELSDIKFHLKTCHEVNDDSYIMKKLPFECPRCIRSFKSKMKLLKHLELNHSLTPINQYQARFDSVEKISAISTDTPVTSSATNTQVNMIKTETSEANTDCGKIYNFNTSASSSTTEFLTKNSTQTANVITQYNNNNNYSVNSS